MVHVVSTRGSAFVLPKNALVRRSTDLLSRGISVPSVAQIVGRASEAGAVLVLATQADIPSTLADAVSRPEYRGVVADHVVVAFSGSAKAPVSKMNEAAAAATDRLAALMPEKTVTLADLVAAVDGGRVGLTAGRPADLRPL